MSLYTKAFQAVVQKQLDSLVNDEVVFKAHDGNPGYEGTEHLVGGHGLPAHYSFSKGGSIGWPLTYDVPCRPWWKLWGKRTKTFLRPFDLHAVTMWDSTGTIPIMRLDLHRPMPIWGGYGNTVTITDVKRPVAL